MKLADLHHTHNVREDYQNNRLGTCYELSQAQINKVNISSARGIICPHNPQPEAHDFIIIDDDFWPVAYLTAQEAFRL